MTKRELENLNWLQNSGLSLDDALALRRIGKTLHRWFEQECGDSNNYNSWCIVRDEETDKPYMEVHPHQGKSYRRPIADRETGARKRLAKLMGRYPTLTAYVQTDPRGSPLYIVRPDDVPEGQDIACWYNRGIAVAV